MGQVVSGLLSLAIGGHFVTKQFTFVTPFTRSLIAIVASLFDQTYITKPKTSRPLNSEIYLVGKGFKGISPELAQALLDRCEAYKASDKLWTTWGSMLQPDILARVDADILVAAQEVHGDQQVSFLNEIYDAYRLNDLRQITNTYEAQAQRAWLDENPLMVISSDDNLNHTQVSAEEEAALFAQEKPRQQSRQQSRLPIQPINYEPIEYEQITPDELVPDELVPDELVPDEDSILIQEDTKGAEGGGTEGGSTEGGSTEGGSTERKTIKFKI